MGLHTFIQVILRLLIVQHYKLLFIAFFFFVGACFFSLMLLCIFIPIVLHIGMLIIICTDAYSLDCYIILYDILDIILIEKASINTLKK